MARVDEVDRVVGSVGQVDGSGFYMDRGVVEAALLRVRWKFYVADVFEN